MEKNINETIEALANYIQEIIKSGSSEELHLLPELINSLVDLINLSSQHSDLYHP